MNMNIFYVGLVEGSKLYKCRFSFRYAAVLFIVLIERFDVGLSLPQNVWKGVFAEMVWFSFICLLFKPLLLLFPKSETALCLHTCL